MSVSRIISRVATRTSLQRLRFARGSSEKRLTVLPEKTRIAFQVRMSFAAFTLRRRWVDGHVVLARRLESPRFRRIDFISPRNQVHVFRLHEPTEVDAEVEAWLAEAYSVGQQHHLTSKRR